MRICFLWFGISGRYGHWNDGLYWALKEIEKEHDVTYHEPTDVIPEDAVVLFWEAPCTSNGPDGAMYKRVQRLPNKKCLLFAGGPIKKEWVDGFDHVFVESKINLDEFTALGVPCSTAFGVNAEMFRPMNLEKKWDGIHQGTSASWKRQWLGAEALKDKFLVVGRFQENDRRPFEESKRYGATVLPEQPYEEIARLLNESRAMIQTADFWGGGQRATLEAMACDVPVICMKDSPKNREYVEESGFGCVTEPSGPHIKQAFDQMMVDPPKGGRDYVLSKWTHYDYAENLMKIVEQL